MKVTLMALRINNRVSRKTAAQELNVSAATIGNWEQGKTFPPSNKLPEICKLYNCTVEDIDLSND